MGAVSVGRLEPQHGLESASAGEGGLRFRLSGSHWLHKGKAMVEMYIFVILLSWSTWSGPEPAGMEVPGPAAQARHPACLWDAIARGARSAERRTPRDRRSATDRGAGHHQFDAAVLLTAGRMIVGGDRLALAEASGANGSLRDAVAHKVVVYGPRPLFRESLVEVGGPHTVRVSFNGNAQARMRCDDPGNPGQLLTCPWLQIGAPGVDRGPPARLDRCRSVEEVKLREGQRRWLSACWLEERL